MTDQSKIPLPLRDKAEPSSDSLIERAAERFDFTRYMAAPRPEALPPKREPALRAKKVGAAPETLPPVPTPVRVERSRDTFAPEPGVPTSLDTNGTGEIASKTAVAETQVAPAIFSTERHAIDREHLRENGLIVPEGSVTGLLEEFRIVKRQLMVQASELRRQTAGSKAQRVLISSPHPGEGKTYCATNLALSIAAEKDSDVLLVDADFAKPSILSALGLPGGPGLMDALMDDKADVAQFVLGTDIPGLWVLPAGNTTTNDSEYLSSARTEKVLERLTQGAPGRMVIFDSPPALAASPAAELAKYVGQAVVIVRADCTGQGALEDAVSLLSSCPNIQLLLNAVQFSPSGRSFGSYYGYRE
ncbi:Mrp family chromosome partitioning ATPase [Novosphingobium chloroacetimidivorans]|uniref:Mrp family chromosome partitioning ATPase n=1 Tax=Novosphingobium chloroacetimidivorans TaxID=1428314 RepID=A0A7W7KA52_9SPHN|nr:capsular biosynthesis protein [Novosphingobium chloroacetimidivorans]MBB4858519.1 Mrp family chromosome partitioning ATPase [Novosphingobium chloroacetimidivorans]